MAHPRTFRFGVQVTTAESATAWPFSSWVSRTTSGASSRIRCWSSTSSVIFSRTCRCPR